MTMTATAPDFNPGYPSQGRLLGPAWQHVWDMLRAQPDEWQDGRVMAEKAAEAVGAQTATVVALISRAAFAGILEREPRHVTVPITMKVDGRVVGQYPGKRLRTFYRIAEGE